MTTASDLELTLRRQSADTYTVEARYTQPDSDADTRLGTGGTFVAHFDFTQLLSLASDPVAYGRRSAGSSLATRLCRRPLRRCAPTRAR